MIHIDSSDYVDGVLASPDKTTLQSIFISFNRHETAPTLGSIISDYSEPCLVHLSAAPIPFSGGAVLEFPSFIVDIDIDSFDSINPSIKVGSILLNDRPDTCQPVSPENIDTISTHWLGFASLEYYHAHDISHPRNIH